MKLCLSGADPENMASHAEFHTRTRCTRQSSGQMFPLAACVFRGKFPCEIIYGQQDGWWEWIWSQGAGGVQKHPSPASDGQPATSVAVASSACRPLGGPQAAFSPSQDPSWATLAAVVLWGLGHFSCFLAVPFPEPGWGFKRQFCEIFLPSHLGLNFPLQIASSTSRDVTLEHFLENSNAYSALVMYVFLQNLLLLCVYGVCLCTTCIWCSQRSTKGWISWIWSYR